MSADYASQLANDAASGPFVSTLCDTGYHEMCAQYLCDGGCDCQCHRPDEEESDEL